MTCWTVQGGVRSLPGDRQALAAIGLAVSFAIGWSPLDAQVPDRPEALLSGPTAPFVVPYDGVLERRLANGLTLVVMEDRSVPLVDIAVAVRVGSVLETGEPSPAPAPGVMELTASLLRLGGTVSATPSELDQDTDGLGLSLRSFGGRHRSGVLGSGPAEEFDRLARLVSEVLTQPRFDVAAVERVRRSLVSGLSGRYNNATALADREWNALVFGRDASRARPLRTTDAGHWTQQALKEAHSRFYTPENTVIAIAGGVDGNRALDLFVELLGGWQRNDGNQGSPATAIATATGARDEPARPGFYQAVYGLAQGTLLMGHVGIERRSWFDADADAALLLAEILAGPGPVSRLRGRLRDRDGLVYSVSGSVGVGAAEPGVVQLAWQVDPANALSALGAALEEIQRLRERPPPLEEVNVARGALVAALPSLFDTAEEIAGRYAEDVLLDRPHEYWQRYASRLSRVTPEQVQQAARRLLRPDAMRAVWVGPRLPTSELKRLGFQRVEELVARDPTTLEPITNQR